MKRRSFHLTTEDTWKLKNVQELQEHATLSEAIRFCIDFCYTELCSGQSEMRKDGSLTLLKKNNLMLRYLLVELTKLHRGEAEPLDATGQAYLTNIRKQLETQLEKLK